MANNQLLASDNFAGGLAAGWSAIFAMSTCQVTGGVTEPNALSTEAGQVWTGLVWPNDHISEGSFTLTNENFSSVQLFVRVQAGSNSGYRVQIVQGVATLARMDAGVSTTLATQAGLTFAAGDIWALSAAGSVLTLYQNYNRVLYSADATYTGGAPGFSLFSNVSITHVQGLSWRGYSLVQQDGIWTKQGVVVPAKASDFASSGFGVWDVSNVLYETGAVLLTPNSDGKIFKMWFIGGGNTAGNPGSTFYAESNDAKAWTRRPTAVLSGFGIQSLVKVSGTYHGYGQSGTTQGTGTISAYTSPDGITWTLQNAAFLSVGTTGQWDANNIYIQCNPVIIGGTWYFLYGGSNSTPIDFNSGIATSPDGITTATKSGLNPVLLNAISGPLLQVGSTFYTYPATGPGPNNLRLAGNAFDPTETIRYSSTDMLHWSATPVRSLHCSQMYESVGAVTGGATSCIILDVGGKAYNYYVGANSDSNAPQFYQISLAIGPASISQIVLQNEDAVVQTSTDFFTSGIGNLSANWATPTGGTKLQIVAGNKVEATTLSVYNAMYFLGASFPTNQYSEITVSANALGSFPAVAVRLQTGANSGYVAQLQGGALGNNAAIVKLTNGTGVAIGPIVPAAFHAGDVLRLSVIGNVLSLFQNGALLLQVEDLANTYTAGSPGMAIFTGTLANAQISSWAGGNANVIPSYPGSTMGPSSGLQSVQFFGRLPNGQIAAVAIDTNGNLAISGGSGGAINTVDVLGNGQATPAMIYGVTPSGKLVAVAVDANGNLCATIGTGGGNPNTTVDIAAFAVPTPVQVVGREPSSGNLYAVPLNSSNALFDSVNPGSTPTASLAAPLAKPRKLILCGRTPSGQIVAVALDASGRLCISGSGSSGSVNVVDVYKNGQPLGIQIFGINASGSLQAVPLDVNGNLSLS